LIELNVIAGGYMYLAKQRGSHRVTSDDPANVEILEIHAAIAIENACLAERNTD